MRTAQTKTLLNGNLSAVADIDSVASARATISNYSASHFSKLFRQLTGDSFTQYLKRFRLETAAERIRTEKAKISEIAMECGFSNLSYFSRAFNERYKMSTSEYRKSTELTALAPSAYPHG